MLKILLGQMIWIDETWICFKKLIFVDLDRIDVGKFVETLISLKSPIKFILQQTRTNRLQNLRLSLRNRTLICKFHMKAIQIIRDTLFQQNLRFNWEISRFLIFKFYVMVRSSNNLWHFFGTPAPVRHVTSFTCHFF